jgi:Outer membrane protein transport protein (OMPP1/FadL/TodX)
MRRLVPLALLAGVLFVRGAASAQLALGQYEDEAPLGTWNTLGAPTAPSLALGGTQFARAWDASVSFANPALLAALPRLSLSVAGSYVRTSLFRYALVNTGVVTSMSNLPVGVLALEHAGFAMRTGPWAFALAASAPESYARPPIVYNEGGYLLTFHQSGLLRILHAGLARRLPRGLSVGVGVNYATGRADRTTIEESADILRTVTITDDKHETYRGVFFNAGLAWSNGSGVTAALALRSPYLKKGTGESLLRYEVPEQGTDIRIDATAANTYRQPWVAGAGASYRFGKVWTVAAEAAWFGWSRYEVTYFDEPLDRAFRDVVKAGAGVEVLAAAGATGRKPRIPLRLGVAIDPQPVTSVRTVYVHVTFGAGLEFRRVALDIAGSVGRESGSGQGLRTGKVMVSLRYLFRE